MSQTWDVADAREVVVGTHHGTHVQFTDEAFLSKKKRSRSFKEIAQRIRKASGEVRPVKTESCPSTSSSWHLPEIDEVATAYLRFCPAILQQQLEEIVAQGGDIEKPICRRYCMALFLVDVSGFTTMSQELGAEATRKHCCAFFDQIINCIMEHGGDVLKFLGDALLVGWPTALPASLEAQQTIAVASAACAKEVMTQLNGYLAQQDDPDHDDDILLTLHGALDVDTVYTYEVGHHDRRQFFIGGDVLGKIGAMEGEAKSGEIIMSPTFAALLPEDSGDVQNSGNVMMNMANKVEVGMTSTSSMISEQLAMQYNTLDRSSETRLRLTEVAKKIISVTRAHVPSACREIVSAGTLTSIGEMRWVTTIFLGLDALIPYLNSGDVEFVQKTFLAILKCVEATGGSIRQMVLDDKGCVVIMCWGTPGAAYGPNEDAARACDCGSQILETLNEESFNFEQGPHMGITAGEAYVGCIGSQWRCGYAMVGPSVNLAARLMCKAGEWQTFVDREVHIHTLAAGARWSFDSRTPVQAKGYKEKVDVFRPKFSQQSNHLEKRRGKQVFIQKWDRLDRYAQMVGKVASILALAPDDEDEEDCGDLCDFSLRALVWVINDLKYGGSRMTKEAVVLLRTSGIVRCTRGSYKGDPSFAFVEERHHQTVHMLFPTEDALRVHRSYGSWIETELSNAESRNDDGEVERAKLALLHHDLDRKLMYHKEANSRHRVRHEVPYERWIRTMMACCTLR